MTDQASVPQFITVKDGQTHCRSHSPNNCRQLKFHRYNKLDQKGNKLSDIMSEKAMCNPSNASDKPYTLSYRKEVAKATAIVRDKSLKLYNIVAIWALCKESPMQKEVRPSLSNEAPEKYREEDSEPDSEQDDSENIQTLFNQETYHSMIPSSPEYAALGHLSM